MSLINITDVRVLDNPTNFLSNYEFEITFECIAPIDDDLEWKLIYVACAESKKPHDQELESLLVGPIPIGVNKFTFQAPAPNPDSLGKTSADILGSAVLLITCSYRDQEFVRIGYYINNEYLDPNAAIPPTTADDQKTDEKVSNAGAGGADEKKDDADVKKTAAAGEEEKKEIPIVPIGKLNFEYITRNILAEKPRVTRFPIKWDNAAEDPLLAEHRRQEQLLQQPVDTQFPSHNPSANAATAATVTESA
ncbi:anti-silencing protein [Ramicandelaber brevisporus]|nr:anti-silencing protein [Ramicandelaber brevisporus]